MNFYAHIVVGIHVHMLLVNKINGIYSFFFLSRAARHGFLIERRKLCDIMNDIGFNIIIYKNVYSKAETVEAQALFFSVYSIAG